MKSARPHLLDFEVDKLTNSIENVATGLRFETEIVRVRSTLGLRLKTAGWAFNWVTEFNQAEHEVFALLKEDDSFVYQGLVSLADKGDHIFMNLLESAPFNKGREKQYAGVAANLVAFVCKKSYERGYRGLVVFESKTNLMNHYEKELGAQRFILNRMFIGTRDARTLITRYFPEYNYDRLQELRNG